MAFCTNCGATVNGAFCPNCGTPAGAPAAQQRPAATAAMAGPAVPAAAQPADPYPPGRRKTSPLVWVLVIVLGLFVLGGIATVAGGYFIYHKVRQAGLDPDLMQRNPGLAVGKLLAAANPDVDVVRTDDGAGTITVRDKKTGKVVTMSFDEAKKGKITFKEEGGEDQSATVEFGASGEKLPSWIPAYPGAKVQGTFSVTGNSAEGEGGTYALTTSDSADKVLAFYQDRLKAAGMTIEMNTTTPQGGMLVAEDSTKKQTATIIIGKGDSDGTSISVTFGVKR